MKRSSSPSKSKRGCGGRLLQLCGFAIIIWGIAQLRERFTSDTPIGAPPFIPVPETVPPAPEPLPAEAATHNDDLTQIQGIGPSYQQKLQAAGITRFAHLAATSNAEFDRILQPRSFQKLAYEGWRQQAQQLSLQPAAADDLTQIQGIGSVFAQKLRAAGMSSFAQLAAQSPEQLATICQAPDWRKPDYQSWIYQAQRLSNSDDPSQQ